MSIWNVLVASSNAVAILPIRQAVLNQDWFTAGCIIVAAMMSFISHLFESHKHDQIGFGCEFRVSYILNRLDVAGVYLLVARMVAKLCAEVSFRKHVMTKAFIFILAVAVCLNLFSERTSRYLFIVTHCVWHILAFALLDYALKYDDLQLAARV